MVNSKLTEIKCAEEVKKVLLMHNKNLEKIIKTDFYTCTKCSAKFGINQKHCDICRKIWLNTENSKCICAPNINIVYNYYKKI
jgi:lipopolysaccharide biosynthesis regulator YciM